jgi:hypothetical protein
MVEDSTMKKIILYFLFCFILLILPPITSGMYIPEQHQDTIWPHDWTILIGLITRPRHVHINGGEYVEFNALILHYRTHWFGNIRAGFFHHFEKIVMPNFHYGLLGAHLIAAKFNMGLAPY